MRKWFKDAFEFLIAVSAALGALWGALFFWGDFIEDLFEGMRHITVHAVTWGGSAGAVIAGLVYLAKRHYSWLCHSAYYFAAPLLPGKAGEVAREMDHFFSGGDKKWMIIEGMVIDLDDHWAARKVRLWVIRIVHILLWPLVIVGGTHTVRETDTTAGGDTVTVAGMAIIVALCGARLGNILLMAMLAAWLLYVIRVQGGNEGEAQAVIIGGGFLLWAAWHEWRRRISYPVDPVADEQDDEGDDMNPDPDKRE